MRRAAAGATLAVAGCAAATGGGGPAAVLNAPVTSRCERAGLDGCEDLVDGAIAYAEGDPVTGQEALERGLAYNLDKAAELEQFAMALEMVGRVPGAGQYVAPLRPAIAVIKKAAASQLQTSVDQAQASLAKVASPSEEPGEPPPDSGEFEVPNPYVPKTGEATNARYLVAAAPGIDCPSPIPDEAVCIARSFPGTTAVVHVLVSSACPGDVVVAAGAPRLAPHWLLWVPAGKGLDLRDVELPVSKTDGFTVGVVGVNPLPDARCGVNMVLRSKG